MKHRPMRDQLRRAAMAQNPMQAFAHHHPYAVRRTAPLPPGFQAVGISGAAVPPTRIRQDVSRSPAGVPIGVRGLTWGKTELLRNPPAPAVAQWVPPPPPDAGDFQALPGPIDRDLLCWDDYWYLVLFPVVGEAFAPFKDQHPDPVGMCVAGMRAVYWYCVNNEWPCCGLPSVQAAALRRAELLLRYLNEWAVYELAREQFLDELQAQIVIPGTCPPDPEGSQDLPDAPEPRGAPGGGGKPVPVPPDAPVPVPPPSPLRRLWGRLTR